MKRGAGESLEEVRFVLRVHGPQRAFAQVLKRFADSNILQNSFKIGPKKGMTFIYFHFPEVQVNKFMNILCRASVTFLHVPCSAATKC